MTKPLILVHKRDPAKGGISLQEAMDECPGDTLYVYIYISFAPALLSCAVHQESSCPAHAHRAQASCIPDSNPYGRDGLAHSRSLSTARRALRVA